MPASIAGAVRLHLADDPRQGRQQAGRDRLQGLALADGPVGRLARPGAGRRMAPAVGAADPADLHRYRRHHRPGLFGLQRHPGSRRPPTRRWSAPVLDTLELCRRVPRRQVQGRRDLDHAQGRHQVDADGLDRVARHVCRRLPRAEPGRERRRWPGGVQHRRRPGALPAAPGPGARAIAKPDRSRSSPRPTRT